MKLKRIGEWNSPGTVSHIRMAAHPHQIQFGPESVVVYFTRYNKVWKKYHPLCSFYVLGAPHPEYPKTNKHPATVVLTVDEMIFACAGGDDVIVIETNAPHGALPCVFLYGEPLWKTRDDLLPQDIFAEEREAPEWLE